MVTTGATQSGTSETHAPDEAGSPTLRRQWACAFPMTGVRYYRFLTDVAEPQESVEPDRDTVDPEEAGQEPGAAVRGDT